MWMCKWCNSESSNSEMFARCFDDGLNSYIKLVIKKRSRRLAATAATTTAHISCKV